MSNNQPECPFCKVRDEHGNLQKVDFVSNVFEEKYICDNCQKTLSRQTVIGQITKGAVPLAILAGLGLDIDI